MSSLFGRNNFTFTDSTINNLGNDLRNNDVGLGPGTGLGNAFSQGIGQKGLSPFCGTFYDEKISGNHLEGIHIQPVLAIDSKARNHSKYPNPNYYDLQLKTTYKDVTKVELKFALIPNSGYVINKANNLFYFQDRCEQVKQCKYYQVEIPCGDWPSENSEGPSLASILEAELNQASRCYGHKKDCTVQSSVPYNACICNCSTSLRSVCRKQKEKNCNDNSDDKADVSSKYSVTFCKYRRKFTIKQVSGSGLFNIIFCGGMSKVGEQGTITQPIMGVDRFLLPEVRVNEYEKSYIARSIGPVLGFSPCNLEGRLEYTSDGVINFDRDRYVILRIPGFERLQSNWDPLQGAFAIIAATRVANDFVFAKWDNDPYNSETYTKYFNPPIPNLSKIRIEFYNSCGEPFDFNGLDHLLLFDISSLTQQTIFPIVPGSGDQC